MKVGLKYPVCAKYDDATGTPVYTGGIVMGRAIAEDLTIDSNNTPVYTDDALDELDTSFKSGKTAIELNDLSVETQAFILGHTINETTGELVANANDSSPYVGHGFYGRTVKNKVSKWRAVWLTKVQFSEPADSNKTQGESVAFQTPKVEGTIMKDVNGDWKQEKTFDNEADAIAYLNGKAGLPVTASAGLTALSMTGTGGALSPTFGASTRYYTYSGVTGTTVTVTATAALHTIKLYVDGVFSQTLTSGAASAAITVAIGTKKLTIVAQESGKTSQTTEIVVVKTA
ncbi:MAG TPA: major tail protein [Mobilitalea sp.]|nr:major tail protein [Mobilitalea sp.]